MKVAVGSKNPTKISAVKMAFNAVWPDKVWEIEGIEVGSGVSDQPMTNEEAITGATNRAQRSLKELTADYGVGLEGGLYQEGEHWFDSGWVVIFDKQGRKGVGSSTRLPIAPRMLKGIREGKELSLVIDEIFGTTNIKHGEGYYGIATNHVLPRDIEYRDGVIMALVWFIHPDLFFEK